MLKKDKIEIIVTILYVFFIFIMIEIRFNGWPILPIPLCIYWVIHFRKRGSKKNSRRELIELKDLLDKGIINNHEYTTKADKLKKHI